MHSLATLLVVTTAAFSALTVAHPVPGVFTGSHDMFEGAVPAFIPLKDAEDLPVLSDIIKNGAEFIEEV